MSGTEGLGGSRMAIIRALITPTWFGGAKELGGTGTDVGGASSPSAGEYGIAPINLVEAISCLYS